MESPTRSISSYGAPLPEAGAEAPARRVLCAACGTEQDAPSGRAKRCVICSKSLLGNGEPSSVRQSEDELIAVAAAMRLERPQASPSSELASVLAVGKWLTSLSALVPVWGFFRLGRSDEHDAQEKMGLRLLSVGLMIALLVGGWALVPSGAQREAELHHRVQAEIETLHGLALGYVHEHGTLPDGDTWHRSAEGGDLRFYDPWGRRYRYERGEQGFTIGTLGRDGLPGGDREDRDIVSEFDALEPAAGDSPTTIAP